MKKVLVTGAGGFLGRYSCLRFKEENFYVVGMGRGGWNGDDYKDFGIDEWVEKDICFDNLKKLDKHFDIILHCAGTSSVSVSSDNPLQSFEDTVGSSLAILEYIRLYNQNAKFIYPSSAAVYGLFKNEPIIEESLLNPISNYGLYKKIVEDLSRFYAENYGVKVGIIRFFSIYGDGMKKQIMWDACNKFKNNPNHVEFHGTGEETRDFVHVEDACDLIIKVFCDDKKFILVNGGSGESISLKYLLGIISKNFSEKNNVKFNKKSRAGDPKYYKANIKKATKLGWRPKEKIENGVHKYVTWFKGQI